MAKQSLFLSFNQRFPELNRRYGRLYPYWCVLCLAPVIIATVFATTSTNMAAHSIEVEFGLTSGASAPMMTWFLVATALAMAFSGALTSRFGHLQTMLLACCILCVSSWAAASSNSLVELSCWRFVQGLAAGLLQPLAIIIGKKTAPTNRLGFFIGIFGAITVLSGAMVPYVSGIIIDNGGWRLLFLITIPPTIFSAMVSLAMISGCEQSTGDQNPRLSTLVLDPDFFRPFTVMFLFGAGFFGSIYLIPLFLQQVSLLSTTKAGILMLPGNFVLAAAFPLFGWLSTSTPPKLLVYLGLFLFGLGSLSWLLADANSSPLILIALIGLGRLGLGMLMPVVNLIAIHGRDGYALNQISALMSLARMLGGAAGVFVCGLVLRWQSGTVQSNDAAFHASFFVLAMIFFLAFIPARGITTNPLAKTRTPSDLIEKQG